MSHEKVIKNVLKKYLSLRGDVPLFIYKFCVGKFFFLKLWRVGVSYLPKTSYEIIVFYCHMAAKKFKNRLNVKYLNTAKD